MRIYLSGKITGNKDFYSQFARKEEELRLMGFEVINPAKTNATLPESTSYEEYMKMCFTMIDISDAICMLNNWHDSKGAKKELEYAIESGKDLMVLG